MIKKLKENERLRCWLLLNFVFSFMLCIFAPLDAYYANMDEFWFSLPQMMSVCGVVFFILLILLNLIAILFYRTKASDILFAAFITMFFYLYIQGNFIPRNYGALTGDKINWSAYPGYAAVSILLGILSLTLFVLLMIRFRKQINAIANKGAALILCILAGTSIVLFVQNGLPARNFSSVVTEKDLFEFSSGHNILVFILDTYDSQYMDQLLEEEYEKTAAIYENFTYYKDTLAGYPYTVAAIPFILTGQWYQNEEPYTDYIQQAGNISPLYKALQENQYTTDIYTNHTETLDPGLTFPENIIPGNYHISGKKEFALKIFRLIAFDYAPHFLKQLFYIDTDEFSKCRASDLDHAVYNWSILNLKKGLNEQGISQSKTGNLFKFIHLDGCHPQYTFGIELEEDGAEYTVMDEVRGNNEILRQYFEALKAAGLYDQTTILIMADHGDLDWRQSPLFMIKNSHEKHPFTVSQIPMSYEYLPTLWETLISGEAIEEEDIRACVPEYGKRRFLRFENDKVADRRSQRYFLPVMRETFCSGPAYDMNSLSLSGKYYLPNQANYSYTLNRTLEFNKENDSLGEGYLYIAYGNGKVGKGLTGMHLPENCLMKFDIQDEYENLYVKIILAQSSAEWNFTIEANGQTIRDITQTKDGVYFIIPGAYVSSGKLELHFYQNDGSDMSASFTDTEIILKNITISSMPQDKTIEDAMHLYQPGTLLGFTADDSTGIPYLQNNSSVPVEEGMEIIGGEAVLQVILQENPAEYTALLKYEAPEEGIHVRFYANDLLIQEQDVHGIETVPLSISRNAIGDDSTLNIKIELKEKIEEGESSEFYLKSIRLDKKTAK